MKKYDFKKIIAALMLGVILGQTLIPITYNASQLSSLTATESTTSDVIEEQTSKSDTEKQNSENSDSGENTKLTDIDTNFANAPPIAKSVSEFLEGQKNNEKIIQVTSETLNELRCSGFTVEETAYSGATIADYATGSLWGEILIFKVNGTYVFCIEPTIPVQTCAVEQTESASAYSSLDEIVQQKIGIYIAYGMEKYAETGNSDYLFATQLWVWKTIRPSSYNDLVSVSNGLQAEIRELNTLFKKHQDIPNFTSTFTWDAPTHTLKWNASKSRYEIILDSVNDSYGTKYMTGAVGSKETFGDYTLEKLSNYRILVYTKNHSAKPSDTLSWKFIPYDTGQIKFYDAGQDLTNGKIDPLYARMKFKIEPSVGDLEITKSGDKLINGSGESTLLSGAEYELKKSSDEVVASGTTDSNGNLYIKDVLTGDYDLCEVKAPTNYVLDSTCKSVTIKANETTNISFWNRGIQGGFKLKKAADVNYSNGSLNINLSGAKFTVRGITDPTYTRTWTTDVNGEINVGKNILFAGEYEIEETSSPTGYTNSGFKQRFNVATDGQIVEINSGNAITNKVIRGGIELNKQADVDYLTGNLNANLAGTEYTVTGITNPAYKKVFVTDSNGNINTSSAEFMFGKYIITETKATAGYINSGWSEEFNITTNAQIIILNAGRPLTNEVIRGGIELLKIGENIDKPTEFQTMEGVEFTVTGITNSAYTKKFYTDSKGRIETGDDEFVFGSYLLTETDADENYFMDYRIEFSIDTDGQMISANNYDFSENGVVDSILNEIFYGKIVGTKIGETLDNGSDEQVSLQGVKFETWKDINGDGILNGGFITMLPYPAPIYVNDYLVEEMITDENGEFTTSNLPVGDYIVKEVDTIDGYILNETLYPVKISSAGAIVNYQEFAVNNNEPIVNDVIKAPIKIVKTDQFGTPIPDVSFCVFDSNPKEGGLLKILQKPIECVVTDNEGVALTGEYKGDVYLQEMSVPEGYIMSEEIYQVDVTSTDTIVVEIQNTLIQNNITVSKVDIVTGKEIEGATLTVSDVDTGKVVEQWISTKEAYEFSLGFGNYELNEIIAPNGYVLSDVTIPFSVTEDGIEQSFVIENKVITNEITVTKVDLATGEEIEGATLTVTDVVTGEIVEQWVSTKETYKFSLGFGKFELNEIIAPEGYVLSDVTIPFSVTEDGIEQSFVIENKIISNEIEITKVDLATGEEIEGAELDVTNLETGQVVEKWTSTKDTYKFTLEYGKYAICETLAPEGYERLTECVKFEVSEEGVVQKFKIENKLIPIVEQPLTIEPIETGAVYYRIWIALITIIVIIGYGAVRYEKRKQGIK